MNIHRFLLSLSVASSIFAQAPAPAPDPATVVVGTIPGRDITLADVQKMLASGEPNFAVAFQQNPEDAISKLLIYQYLSEEAEKRKLAEQSPVKEQLQALRTQLLREAVVNDETNNYPVSNAELEAYYNAHKAEFQQTKIKVIYIPFRSETPVTGTSNEALFAAAQAAIGVGQQKRSEAEAKVLATDIVKKLREGLDFSKAVEQYSEDPTSKAAGGDYGVIKADSAYPEDFRRAVLALKAGDISEPLRQPAGYYVIRGEETTAQPMNELLTPLTAAIRKEHLNSWFKSVTENHTIIVKDPKLLQGLTGAGIPSK